MTWHQGHLVWPASAGALHEAVNGVTSQIPDAQSAAINRLLGLAVRAQYRPHPLSEAATALARKDYVDAQVATRTPTTHSHTAEKVADWRVYYKALYSLDKLESWPIVEVWPIAPAE